MTKDKNIGAVLDGKYRLEELLGKGGMGAVYRGRHVVIGKTVAVKFLHEEFSNNPEVLKRFYREAQSAAAIGHENIIDVMDMGVSPDNETYLVMEFLEGESLGAMLNRTGPIGIAAACAVMEPALLALHAAHQKGIVHRDLKPDNIFLVHREGQEPKIKLIDFGISKVSEGAKGEKLTQTGSVMGTPAYMSPEQARGVPDLDRRSDVYSMGVILYEMLTGRLPFSGENFTSMIINILTTDPVRPADAFPGFPMEAEELLLRCLVKDPKGRYQTALEFLDALKGLSGFAERHEKLIQATRGVTKKTFAAGDLGTSISSSSGKSVAAELLSEMAGGTPTGWAGTRPGAAQRSLWPVVALAGVAALVIAGAILVLFLVRKNEAPAVIPVALQPAPEVEKSVEISIVGAPEQARIFFNESEVKTNPFTVEKGNTIVPLKVEANGFEPFSVSVKPSADRVIQVSLRPKAPPAQPAGAVQEESAPRDPGAGSHGKGKGHPGAAGKEPAREEVLVIEKPEPPPPKPPEVIISEEKKPEPEQKKAEPEQKKSMIKGARGTKIQTSFE